jgi:thioredoxin 1
MSTSQSYSETAPDRSEVDALAGPAVIEFGTSWCEYCQAAQPLIASAFASHPSVRRLRIEDGKGRPLGRSFGVKLWPTLIFLQDGIEVNRVVRPTDVTSMREALDRIDP